ncbi:radical SAM-linked protein [Mumia flava]|uniref:Radical SAM-linked protein n=1 Tax=Mumia flava TaxID=1348852 RepID=A0A2M9B7R6_9ACTN|nr:TIGR03936 family radical SAM-associated protein [Mumia flava]PJJ53999.1 radical SAM-linked protein [Mumia flava]
MTSADPTKSNPEAPNPQLPTVQRLRIRYAKRGRLRFTSHRDFGRAFERAVRRAGVPIAYSSGYTPHPKISYAGAAPTGAASEAEYLEIGVTRPLDPADVHRALDAALPPGLDVLDVTVGAQGRGALAERLQASSWRLRLTGVAPQDAVRAAEAFMQAPEVTVERMTKKGLRSFDARAAVVSLVGAADPDGEDRCAILDLVVRHGTPSVRPDDVLAGLRAVADFAPSDVPVATRVAQGPLDPETGTVGDPFATDRDAS